jgi:hypothetical protein
MPDEKLTAPPRVGDLDPGDITLEAELIGNDAEREIDKAVRGRRFCPQVRQVGAPPEPGRNPRRDHQHAGAPLRHRDQYRGCGHHSGQHRD